MPYSERYVAFGDILGFSEIVRKTERDLTPTRYDALVKTLTEIGLREHSWDEMVGDDFKFQAFSDFIVMSSNATEIGLSYLLDSLNKLSLRLLINGLMVRGAVARGKLHHEGSVMFGPAFLEAYRSKRPSRSIRASYSVARCTKIIHGAIPTYLRSCLPTTGPRICTYSACLGTPGIPRCWPMHKPVNG